MYFVFVYYAYIYNRAGVNIDENAGATVEESVTKLYVLCIFYSLTMVI